MAQKGKVDADFRLKFMFVGDSGVGKSSLLIRYIHGAFNPHDMRPSVVADFKTKTINLPSADNRRVQLQVWDTAGSQQFTICSLPYFQNVDMYMLVYDVTKRETFDSMDDWIHEIKINAGKHAKIVLLANKCDEERKRVVSYEEGAQLAKEDDLAFYETSACQNLNLDRIFLDCAAICTKGMTPLTNNNNNGIFSFLLGGSSNSNKSNTSPDKTVSTATSDMNGNNTTQAQHKHVSFPVPSRNDSTLKKTTSTHRLQQEHDFFYEFQSKSKETIVISGINTSYRKGKFNGMYRPCKGFIIPKYVHVVHPEISLVLYNSVWYLKSGEKTICKVHCLHNNNCMPYLAKTEHNAWYERVGIFLPIFRQMVNINCDLNDTAILTQFYNAPTTTDFASNNGRVSLFVRPSLYFQIPPKLADINDITAADTDNNSDDDDDDITIENNLDNSFEGTMEYTREGGGDGDTGLESTVDETNNAILSASIKFQLTATQAGLTPTLFLQYAIIKLALLDLDVILCSKNKLLLRRVEVLRKEKNTITDLYHALASSTGAAVAAVDVTAADGGDAKTAGNNITLLTVKDTSSATKQTVCTALESLIIDASAHYAALAASLNIESTATAVGALSLDTPINGTTVAAVTDSATNAVSEEGNKVDRVALHSCLQTCDQLNETLKHLLLSDMSLVADRIEWIVAKPATD